jgi:hypothetical protein
MYVSEHLEELSWNAWGTIQTTDKVSFKDGLTMSVVAEAFEDGPDDKWISFTISDSQKTSQGAPGYGNGFGCLIRPTTSGSNTIEPYLFNDKEALKYLPSYDFTANCNIYEGEALTLEIKKEDGKYNIYLCGVAVNKVFQSFIDYFPDEEAYIGVTGHAGTRHDMKLTVTEFNGVKPQGTKSVKPYEPEDIKTPGTKETTEPIEAGKPCFLWSPLTHMKSNSPGTGMTGTIADDGSVHVTFGETAPQLSSTISIEYWYDAAEFPIFALMFKGLDEIGNAGSLWYCAGEVYSARNDAVTQFSWGADYEGDDDPDSWKILIIDLEGRDNWYEGDRINSYRLDIAGDGSLADEEADLMWAGFFRTAKDAMCFDSGNGITLADYYEREYGSVEDTTEKVTEPAPVETEPGKVETQPASGSDDTQPAATEKIPETKDTGKPAAEKNNTWIIIVIIAAVVVAAGVACIFIFKNKKKQ